MTDDQLAELLRHVLARPDDHDVLHVYADALIERGDLRGELIALQLERVTADSDALVAREQELIDRLDDELAAKLVQRASTFRWERGFVDEIDFTPSPEGAPLADTLRQIGVMPAARRLRRIIIRFVYPGWGSMGPVLSTLSRVAPQLRSLRELVFTFRPRAGVGVPHHPLHFGDLAPVCRALPRLEVLEVAGVDYGTLRDIDAQSLKRLVLEGAAGSDVVRIARRPLPNLRELEIHDGNWSFADFSHLLERDLPLRSLVLTSKNPEVIRNVMQVLPASPVFRTVRRFALRGPFDRACLDYVAHHAARLRQLDRFETEPLADAARARVIQALGDTVYLG